MDGCPYTKSSPWRTKLKESCPETYLPSSVALKQCWRIFWDDEHAGGLAIPTMELWIEVLGRNAPAASILRDPGAWTWIRLERLKKGLCSFREHGNGFIIGEGSGKKRTLT